VDGLLAICTQEGLRASDIAEVQTRVSEAAVRNLMYGLPADPMQARFSMPYCLAAAACDGDLRLATFRTDAIGRPELLAFLPRVTMLTDPEQPADMPSTVRSWATTTVTTHAGERHTRRGEGVDGVGGRSPIRQTQRGRAALQVAPHVGRLRRALRKRKAQALLIADRWQEEGLPVECQPMLRGQAAEAGHGEVRGGARVFDPDFDGRHRFSLGVASPAFIRFCSRIAGRVPSA
jgi:2-methylcitrate dehydratase PrpD